MTATRRVRPDTGVGPDLQTRFQPASANRRGSGGQAETEAEIERVRSCFRFRGQAVTQDRNYWLCAVFRVSVRSL